MTIEFHSTRAIAFSYIFSWIPLSISTENEHERILKQRNVLRALRRRGKLCFKELARVISKRWDNGE